MGGLNLPTQAWGPLQQVLSFLSTCAQANQPNGDSAPLSTAQGQCACPRRAGPVHGPPPCWPHWHHRLVNGGEQSWRRWGKSVPEPRDLAKEQWEPLNINMLEQYELPKPTLAWPSHGAEILPTQSCPICPLMCQQYPSCRRLLSYYAHPMQGTLTSTGLHPFPNTPSRKDRLQKHVVPPSCVSLSHIFHILEKVLNRNKTASTLIYFIQFSLVLPYNILLWYL